MQFQPYFHLLDDELIGFTVYATDPEDGNYWIMAFMIDKHHQNKGYGKLAMIKLIAFIKEMHGCDKIILGHRVENELAARLYSSLGFKEISRNEHEITRCLELLD